MKNMSQEGEEQRKKTETTVEKQRHLCCLGEMDNKSCCHEYSKRTSRDNKAPRGERVMSK